MHSHKIKKGQLKDILRQYKKEHSFSYSKMSYEELWAMVHKLGLHKHIPVYEELNRRNLELKNMNSQLTKIQKKHENDTKNIKNIDDEYNDIVNAYNEENQRETKMYSDIIEQSASLIYDSIYLYHYFEKQNELYKELHTLKGQKKYFEIHHKSSLEKLLKRIEMIKNEIKTASQKTSKIEDNINELEKIIKKINSIKPVKKRVVVLEEIEKLLFNKNKHGNIKYSLYYHPLKDINQYLKTMHWFFNHFERIFIPHTQFRKK
jgi:hypothetical protein